MKNQRRLGFVLSYISIFVSSMVGIAFTPYMISTLGKIEYGLYQLLYATIGYFALLDFGLGSTQTRFIIKYRSEGNEDKVNSVISISLKIYCFIAALVLLLVMIFSSKLDRIYPGSINGENLEYAQKLFVIMGATTAISLISHALSGIQTAEEKYVYIKGIYIARQVVRVVIAIVLLQLNIGAMAIVLTDFFVTATLLLMDILFCKMVLKVKLLKGKWDFALTKSLFAFSFFVFLQIIITQSNASVSRMLLGALSTLEVVAMYGIITQLCQISGSISNVVCGVTFPQISRVVFSNPERNTLTNCCAQYSRYQLLISAPLLGGFLLLGKTFMSLWVPEYDSSALWICTMIILFPEVLATVQGTVFHVMKAKNMQKMRSLILFGVMVVNIVLTILLINVSPIYGPAISTSVSYILGNILLSNIYYHKRVGVNIFLYIKTLLKGIFPAWVLSLLIGLAIAMIPVGGWFGFILKGVLYTGQYCILVLLIGFNKSEKALIKQLCNKFFKKNI